MDAAYAASLVAVAGTASSGLLGLAGLLVKRHLAFLAKLEANDDEKTKSLGTIASELTRTREVQQQHGGRLDSLEKVVLDKRQEEATAASRAATAALLEAKASITGKHAAVDAQREDLMADEREAEPLSGRPRSRLR
jgi:septal ring factor EnvC (AmiA/AmiB activator)